MYDANTWGLRESPFGTQSEEAWFFEAPGHAEALARLFYLIEERQPGGVLVGPEGVGKSLMLNVLARNVARSRRQVATLDLTALDEPAAVWKLASELRLAPKAAAGLASWWRAVEDFLCGAGYSRLQTVILLDHLDQADTGCARFIERLSGMSRKSRGQTTIISASRDLSLAALFRPLQRMTVLRIELLPFNAEQTAEYVALALRQAGSSKPVFTRAALLAVHETTHGVPRQVNQLCQVALLAAIHDELRQIEPDVVRHAAAELAMIA